MPIHHHMLTPHHHQRSHDQPKRPSTQLLLTLMLKIMTPYRVSMSALSIFHHMETYYWKMTWRLKWDDTFKDYSKVHPRQKRSHLKITDVCTMIYDIEDSMSTSYDVKIQGRSAEIQNITSGVTSLRGRLLGIWIFSWRLGHPEYLLDHHSS